MSPVDVSAARRSESRAAGTLLPYAALTVTMLCWAGNWVVGRAIREAMPPIALTFWRWGIALLLLAPFALPRLRGKGAVLRRHWAILLALGATGVTLFQMLIYVGLRTTTTVNAVLLNSAAPLFIILCSWLLERDRASPRQFLGMIISFAGIVVILVRGELAGLLHLRFAIGDLAILAAMPVWGVYAVLLKRRPHDLDGLGLLFSAGIAGLILLTPLYLAETLLYRAPILSLASAGAVLYVAFFASGVAYVCWNYGVAAVGPNRAGFMIHLLPAFGTVLAILFLGESVRLYHGVGIGMILAGVFVATTSRTA